jgi:hypothetical protein
MPHGRPRHPLRGAAIGICFVLGLAAWRARPNSGFGWTGLLYAGGVIAYLLLGHPGIANWRPLGRLVAGAFAFSAPFFFWAQARLIFDDGFRLGIMYLPHRPFGVGVLPC